MSGPVPGTPEYLLMKRGLYYRANNCGYTGIKDNAGRYFATDARPDCGVTAIHQDEAAEFSPACFEDLAREHLKAQRDTLEVERDALKARVQALRDLVANLYCASGCSCCRDDEVWHDASAKLGEMLEIPAYDDGSGHNFYAVRDAALAKGEAQ